MNKEISYGIIGGEKMKQIEKEMKRNDNVFNCLKCVS